MNIKWTTKLAMLVLGFALFSSTTYSQKNPVIIDSKKLIKEGIELFDKGNFKEAKELFLQIQFPDSNYFWAQYELSLIYINDSLYDQAIDVSKNAIIGGSPEPSHYNIWGTSLDNQKKASEALEVYNAGIKKFPFNESLKFNKAIVYEGTKDNKEAIEIYKSILQLSPYAASTHLRLARLCALEGLYTQAVMSYICFLIIEPDSKRSLTVLSEVNNLCNGSLEDVGTSKTNVLKQEYEDIDLLVTNQVALSNKYKVPGKFKYAVIKQLHLIMDKLSETPSQSPDFYAQFYAPIMVEFKKANVFETLGLLILASSDNDDIVKQISKKKNEIIALREKCMDIMLNTNPDYEVNLNGKKQKLTKWYYKSHKINALGKENEKKQNIGDWCYVTSDGSIEAFGQFNNEGLKTGKWTFFEANGDTSKVISYSNGKPDGPYVLYSEGFKSENGKYKNGLLDGLITGYYPDGSISFAYNYLDSKYQGEAKKYFRIGSLKIEGNFANDLREGAYKEYFPNKNLYENATYKAGKYEGNFKEYYEDGNIRKDFNYKNGILVGSYTTYFRNGIIESTGNAVNGSVSGEWKNNYSDGILESISNFDESGKINGEEISYDHQGIKFKQTSFQKGDLKNLQYFDKNGKSILNLKVEKSGTVITNYTFQRDKISEGKLVNGKREGEWKFYYASGLLSSSELYKKDLLDGLTVNYFDNGKVSSKQSYTEDKRNGIYNNFYPTGELKTEGNYVDDEKWGPWYVYFKDGKLKNESYYMADDQRGYEYIYVESGKLFSKIKYNNYGFIEGFFNCDTNGVIIDSVLFKSGTVHYTLKGCSGKIANEGNYKNGMKHGMQQWMHPNGKISIKGDYYSGYPDGPWFWYYPNGTVSSKGQYFQGEKTGVWEYYDFFGNMTNKSEFKYGKNDGTITWYFKDGKVDAQSEYFDDDRHKNSYYYADNGDLRILRYYEFGKLIGYSYHDKNKKLVDTIFSKNGDAEIVAYFYNGTVSTKFSIKNGAYHGEYKSYYPSGKIQEERLYDYGNEIGPTIEYYADGKISRKENYLYGDLHGELTDFYPSGNKRIIENYKYGQKNGLCQYFDKTGKLINAYIYYNNEVVSIIQ